MLSPPRTQLLRVAIAKGVIERLLMCDGYRECVCVHTCVCAGEPSAFGCLLPVIMTWGDSSNQSALIMYCYKCLAWIKGVSRFLFHPSKETCYYSIVSGISGNPGKCPDMFSLKIKLSGFLSQNSSNSWVSPEWWQYPEVSVLERFMQQKMSAFVLSNALFFPS